MLVPDLSQLFRNPSMLTPKLIRRVVSRPIHWSEHRHCRCHYSRILGRLILNLDTDIHQDIAKLCACFICIYVVYVCNTYKRNDFYGIFYADFRSSFRSIHASNQQKGLRGSVSTHLKYQFDVYGLLKPLDLSFRQNHQKATVHDDDSVTEM